ncbi:PREDICTED: extensin-like [Nicotiana attenuata]|uniref:extensin-like n=1 Tax=Nicotiana attenuata TaxID=49451 RepID=UPI000904D0D1|nr:PREDICTED: extensin-like [Nicotiana attenuata]
MYQAWAKGQPPPAYPANPAFIPSLAQSQDHPATDSSPGFPIYQHYQSTTSQTPPAPPPKPVPYPPPPATPVFVAPLPATLHRSSSEPLFQAHDNQYYPPEPTLKALEPYSYTPHFDLSAKTEKPPKNPKQEEMIRKYNLEIVPNRLSLTRIEKKPGESFREYGFH